MYRKLLLMLGLVSFPAFASPAAYVCTQESDGTALLGETFSLQADDEQASLSSEAIGHCTAGEEGELSGETCAVADEVSVEFDDELVQGEDEGYVYASTEDDEALYSCEAIR